MERDIHYLFIRGARHHSQHERYALYSHEELHKTNILVQPLNRLHLSLSEREAEYLQCLKTDVSQHISCFTSGLLFLSRCTSPEPCKQTSKFFCMRTWLKLFGMTTTPLCTLNLRATWAEVLLYFLATETRSSSSNSGGHFRFTLFN